MVVQVLLQVGERTLDLVVRIRHSLEVLMLVVEEVRQIEVQAVHRSPQPLVVSIPRNTHCDSCGFVVPLPSQ